MNDGTVNPRFDDDRLDDLLLAAPRPRPGRGFADRVLARTRLPLPTWLVPIRDWFRGVTSGVRGWLILAVMAMATLAGWGAVASLAWQEREAIGRAADIAASEVAVPAAQSVDGVREVVIDRVFDWIPFSIPALKFFLILYAAVALVCLLGLWWLTRTPRAAEVSNA